MDSTHRKSGRPTALESPCPFCPKPVDLRRACMIWPNGKVAHVDCYNRGRLQAHGRPAQQRELPGATS